MQLKSNRGWRHYLILICDGEWHPIRVNGEGRIQPLTEWHDFVNPGDFFFNRISEFDRSRLRPLNHKRIDLTNK